MERQRRAGHRGQPFHPRRGMLKLTAIVMNNRIYGMTGGASTRSPGSGCRRRRRLRQHRPRDGSPSAQGDLRGADDHPTMREMISIFKLSMRVSVSWVLSRYPTYFGHQEQARRRRTDDGYRDRTAPVGSPKLAENPTLVPRGFTDEDRPDTAPTSPRSSPASIKGVNSWKTAAPVSCCPFPAARA